MLTSRVVSQLSACFRISGEISTPSFQRPIRNTILMFLAVYVVARASCIVWKFFKLLDILLPMHKRQLYHEEVRKPSSIPAIERWPICYGLLLAACLQSVLERYLLGSCSPRCAGLCRTGGNRPHSGPVHCRGGGRPGQYRQSGYPSDHRACPRPLQSTQYAIPAFPAPMDLASMARPASISSTCLYLVSLGVVGPLKS